MLSNGKYVVLFNRFDMSGRLTGQQLMGGFSVSDNAITNTEGVCQGMLPKGAISNQTELRIFHGMNTGYWEVRHDQGFRPRPLQKSEKLTVSKGKFGKFLKAYENDLAQGIKNITIDRTYWVPGLAGYSLDGTKVYIDGRLPEMWNGVHTDKYLVIHEVTEKSLMDKLGFSYGYAHDMALEAERHAVEADGLNWDEYEKHMWNFIHAYSANAKVPKEKRPPDLDPDRITHDRSIKDIMRHSLRKSAKTTDLPRVASIAVRQPETGHLLMGARNDNGLWTMPGGHLNDGETPEDGAKRELFEETGIKGKKLKFLGSGKVKNDEGKELMIYSFLLDGEFDTDTEQDPDEEVQDWKYISESRYKQLDKDGLLHVPADNNVTKNLLENKTKAQEFLKKADRLNQTDDGKPEDWYSDMRKDLFGRKRNEIKRYTPEDLHRFIHESKLRGDDNAMILAVRDANHDESNTSAILNHHLPELKGGTSLEPLDLNENKADYALEHGKISHDDFDNIINFLSNAGQLPHGEEQMPRGHTNTVKRAAERLASEDGDSIENHTKRLDRLGEIAGGAALPLSRNKNLSGDQLETLNASLHEGHMDFYRLREFCRNLAAHDNTNAETLKSIYPLADKRAQKSIALHNNISIDFVKQIAADKSTLPEVRDALRSTLVANGHYPDDVKTVSVRHGVSKARMARDWIEAHGGSMHKKELEAAGLDPKAMGLSHLQDAKGKIASADVQKHIDLQPTNEYIVTHSKYGFDQQEDYEDINHPDHEKYISYDGYGGNPTAEEPHPTAEQRHSSEPSRVMQLSTTPEQIQKMKDAGVHGTFRKMNKKSVNSDHPVAAGSGIGWVRYTKKPDGIFIDEIQSDLGSSVVRKARSITQKQVQAGEITQHEADGRVAKEEAMMPEEHYKKIKDIIFGGKEAGEVLHEAFNQHLRDTGHAGTPVHIWSAKGKAKIAGQSDESSLPVHMTETYDKQPKAMGYVPAKYGEISTQSSKDHKEHAPLPKGLDPMGTFKAEPAAPTMKTTLRKSKKKKK